MTHGVDFTNVLAHVFCAHFSFERLFSSYVLVTYKKRERKMRAKTLVKSTHGHKVHRQYNQVSEKLLIN